MTRLALAVCLLLVACAGPAADVTTTTTRVTLPPVTTSIPPVQVQLEDCDQPPVTFSALCESFELLSDWHVDRPVDLAGLAALARDALTAGMPDDLPQAEPPRTLFCAIPGQQFSPFCDDLADLIQEKRVDVRAVMDVVVTTAIEGAYGPFTYYLPPDQITGIRDNGIVGGLGILLDATNAVGSKCARLGPTCPLRIVTTLDDNPGKEAGLEPGDVILEVDGVPVDGQGFAATAAQIAGDETGTVTLLIERRGDRIEFTITREHLVVPTVTSGIVDDGVAYMRIPDFESDVPDLVDEAFESLGTGWSTMVVDLRDNPGGFIFSVVEVASEFVPEGPLFLEDETGELVPVDSVGTGGRGADGRLIVLVNEGTASAAEILAGALRDRRGAVVIGAPTFGKDAVQIRFDLRNGGRLDVQVAHWLTPDGTSVGNGGLIPDVELELTHDMTVSQLVQAALGAAP